MIAPFPASEVDFIGFGDGPGLGMGQWGAFGYAVSDHETYSWILAHYYGGTTLTSADARRPTIPRSRSTSTRTTATQSL